MNHLLLEMWANLSMILCLFSFYSSEKPSTVLWTRALLRRPVCPPTTTPCWASTTPGMTSRCERPVRLHPMVVVRAEGRFRWRLQPQCYETVVSSSCNADSRLTSFRQRQRSAPLITSTLGCQGFPASPTWERIGGSGAQQRGSFTFLFPDVLKEPLIFRDYFI